MKTKSKNITKQERQASGCNCSYSRGHAKYCWYKEPVCTFKGSKTKGWIITMTNAKENFIWDQALLDEEIPCLIDALNKIEAKRRSK